MDAGAVQLELVLTGYKDVERQLAGLRKNVAGGYPDNPFKDWDKAVERAAAESRKLKRSLARGDNKVNFEIAGLKVTNRQLRLLRVQARLTSRSVRASFAKMSVATEGFRAALSSAFAQFAGFAALGFAVVDATRKTIKLEQATNLLNRTLGESGPIAAQFISNLTARTGGSVSQTTEDFAKFSAAATAAGVDLRLQKDVFEQTAQASLAFGLSTQQSKRSLQALQQIASKGVVSMEEVRQQLGEQLPVAIAATAKGAEMSIKDLIDLISSGGYKSEDFFKAYAKGMKEFNANAAEADTATVAIRKLQDAFEKLQIAFGESLLPSITEGIKGLTKALGGIGKSIKASKVSGGDGLLGFLGFQGFASKEVVGWQESLIARGTLTQSEIDALITDAVKDIEGSVYNGIGRININPQNADSIFDTLIEKVLAYEEKVKGRGSLFSDEERKARALLSAEDERLKRLAKTNEELKRSEALALAQAKALYGPETQKVIEAQIKLAQARRDAAAFKDKTTVEAQDAASAQLVAAEEAAQTIKDAYKEARNAAVDAADALGKARSDRAKQLFNKDEGINQFLSGGALGARRKEGIQLQKNEAGRLKRELVKSFAEAGNFAAARQIGGKRFGSFEERQKFIDAARDELYGQKALITANEKLEKALTDLNTTIIKGFDGGSTAQKEDYRALKDSIDSLVQKDWTVGVEARLEADGSISVQNALS